MFLTLYKILLFRLAAEAKAEETEPPCYTHTVHVLGTCWVMCQNRPLRLCSSKAVP
jgi:hypothetical protein